MNVVRDESATAKTGGRRPTELSVLGHSVGPKRREQYRTLLTYYN